MLGSQLNTLANPGPLASGQWIPSEEVCDVFRQGVVDAFLLQQGLQFLIDLTWDVAVATRTRMDITWS